MNVFVKLKTEDFGEYNIYDILHSPEIFNTEVFECIDKIYSSCFYEKNIFHNLCLKTNFQDNDGEDTLLDFIIECEYLGFKELLKDTAIKKYLHENAKYIHLKFGLKSNNIFYTDGELFIDYRLEKVYKSVKNKMIFVGNFYDTILSYELSWFNKIYFKNINEKYIKDFLVNIKRNKLGKKKFLEKLEEVFSDNLLDVSSSIADLVYMDFEYNKIKKYVDYFITKENFIEFKRRKNEKVKTI